MRRVPFPGGYFAGVDRSERDRRLREEQAIPGHGLAIAYGDEYVVRAAGFWLSLWQRRRRALWRGRSPWGTIHPDKVQPCSKTAESSACSAPTGTE
jgi:hypothetical protein